MNRINLIPAAVQITQSRRRRTRRWSLLVGLALAGSTIPVTAQWLQQRNLDDLREKYTRVESNLETARSDLKSLTAESGELFLRLERAKSLRAKRNWSGMLAMLGSALPADCWLTSLATDPDIPPPVTIVPKAAAAASPAPGKPAAPVKPAPVMIEAPRRLRIVGHSVEASGPLALVLRLKESGAFQDVILERSQRESADPQSPFRFEMVCEW